MSTPLTPNFSNTEIFIFVLVSLTDKVGRCYRDNSVVTQRQNYEIVPSSSTEKDLSPTMTLTIQLVFG